jgi:hypothetical protein
MAGAGYKLFNTGDVLTAAQVNTYLMEQSVMVFADAAARTTALTGVVAEGMLSYLKDTNAVEVYDGANWVASDDPNAIQNTIVDAKGDLITATAADTPARLAVGNSGETLVADSATATGLNYKPLDAAGKNAIINGGMDIWQRGTSFLSTGGNAYTADRWAIGASGLADVTQTTALVTPNSQYMMLATAVGTTQIFMRQVVETSNAIRFAGKTVTLSAYAAGLTTTTNLKLDLQYSTSVNTAVGGSWTSITATSGSNLTLSGTVTRFSGVFAIPSTAKTLRLNIHNNAATITAGQGIYLGDVQLELGSVATEFSRAGGTIQGELAACQRYFQKSYGQGVAPATATSTNGLVFINNAAQNVANTDKYGYIKLPVVMRAAPTVTTYSYTSGTATAASAGNGTDLAANSAATEWVSDSGFALLNSSGGTINQAGGGFAVHYRAVAEL